MTNIAPPVLPASLSHSWARARLHRYSALGIALSLTPEQLGALSVARGLTQALVSPIAGLLGDTWHRGRIIVAGTLAWAAFSLAFGLCVNYSQVPPTQDILSCTTNACVQMTAPLPSRCSTHVQRAEACAASITQALAFAALSGAGLALVMPCVTAILSDLHAEEQRGVAFGWILCAAGAGAAAHAVVDQQCLRACVTCPLNFIC